MDEYWGGWLVLGRSILGEGRGFVLQGGIFDEDGLYKKLITIGT